jgi:hypothetical protein
MGMFAAVGSVYANMFNFSGRARRAEYWWYFLFILIMNFILHGGLIYWLIAPEYIGRLPKRSRDADRLKQYQDQCCAGPATPSSARCSFTGSRNWP